MVLATLVIGNIIQDSKHKKIMTLLWAIKKKMFLKLQIGTGDNLSDEDIKNGYKSYILWNTFSPGELDLDSYWQPDHEDGGIYLTRSTTPSLKDELPEIYELSFNEKWKDGDTVVLWEG